MKKLLSILCLLLMVGANAQTPPQTLPSFPGGEKAYNQFIKDNFKLPLTVKECGIPFKIFFSFTVGGDSVVSKPEVLHVNGGCYECNTQRMELYKKAKADLIAEGYRLISLLPRMVPGTINGKPTTMELGLPIAYKP